jgi:hypothetical protein
MTPDLVQLDAFLLQVSRDIFRLELQEVASILRQTQQWRAQLPSWQVAANSAINRFRLDPAIPPDQLNYHLGWCAAPDPTSLAHHAPPHH